MPADGKTSLASLPLSSATTIFPHGNKCKKSLGRKFISYFLTWLNMSTTFGRIKSSTKFMKNMIFLPDKHYLWDNVPLIWWNRLKTRRLLQKHPVLYYLAIVVILKTQIFPWSCVVSAAQKYCQKVFFRPKFYESVWFTHLTKNYRKRFLNECYCLKTAVKLFFWDSKD